MSVDPPAIENPQRYTGLYAFDFGGRISFGYTANEITLLQRTPDHADGQAYLIVSVDPDGRMALRGVKLDELSIEEGMIFAHDTVEAAATSFEQLRELAKTTPVPQPVHVESANWPDHEPPHVVVLSYRSHASSVVSQWLLAVGFDGGDHVSCGVTELAEFRVANPDRISICDLRTRFGYTSRSATEVLESVHLPVQRP